jgi:hypothetical protein
MMARKPFGTSLGGYLEALMAAPRSPELLELLLPLFTLRDDIEVDDICAMVLDVIRPAGATPWAQIPRRSGRFSVGSRPWASGKTGAIPSRPLSPVLQTRLEMLGLTGSPRDPWS